MLPGEYVRAMRASMLDKCPIESYAQIARTVREDLGRDPDELFASFARTPIASASLAQVCSFSSPYGLAGLHCREQMCSALLLLEADNLSLIQIVPPILRRLRSDAQAACIWLQPLLQAFRLPESLSS